MMDPIQTLALAEAALRLFEGLRRQVKLHVDKGNLTPEQLADLNRRAAASDHRIDQKAEQARARQSD